jgi:DNA-binding NarL/FixJ family response regulator
VLVLTTFEADEYVYQALQAGASGFLLKDTTPRDLIDAVHTVAGGDALLAPTITRRLIESYLPRRSSCPVRLPGRAVGRHAGGGRDGDRVARAHLPRA